MEHGHEPPSMTGVNKDALDGNSQHHTRDRYPKESGISGIVVHVDGHLHIGVHVEIPRNKSPEEAKLGVIGSDWFAHELAPGEDVLVPFAQGLERRLECSLVHRLPRERSWQA